MKTLFFIFILCFLSSFLHATIINVPTPYATIQAGIDAATNNDTVLVQPGTYVENINFNGKLITLGSLFLTTQDTTYISSTIIDGNSSGTVVTFENSEDSTAVLCGFTITDGLGSGNYPDYCGGGITCRISSNPSLENLIITNNSAIGLLGGGILCYINSNPSLENVIITSNSAYIGGGIYCQYNSNPSLQNVIISGNSTTQSGGGFYCRDNSSPNLQNVTITGNSANAGGGIHCDNSSPSLDNVTITGNSAGSWGGGIYCRDNSSPNLQNVTITGNSANAGGGIHCRDNSSPSLDNVTISGNIASDYGGGIYCNNDSNLSLINSILWNDSPQEIYIESGSVTATYSDIQGGWTGTGNIDSDPLFVDPGNGNYHLQPTSPCIDAGDPASPLDPDCTIADMGAYYFNQYDGPVWHISTTGSDLTGTGCEQNPFATIQHGIDTSADTDTVLVQPGTYVENIDFNGKNITVGSLFLTTLDTTYIFSTVIDGNSSGSVVTFNSGEDSTAVLCGFIITNGSTPYSGGGIFCSLSSPSLENVTITGNSAGSWGGGITCYDSSPSLENVTISGNSAGNYGGGICCYYYSTMSLVNVTISGNSASYGGGIYCWSNSTPILQNATISCNFADYGGGIYCNSSSPILQNVTISGNSATYAGGGINCSLSSPSLENVTITGNSANNNGGGIYCNSSSPSLINSILWNDSPEEIYLGYLASVTATYTDIQGGFTGTGNIDDDPLFVDPGNGDYHLQSTSPCIDAGDPASPLDPDNTIADMGAYYFHHSGPVWHISTTGSDITGNGSEQYPFATIQLGINYSVDTDTVLVQPGTYVENINYNGKLITVASLFLTTQDTTYISSTYIDGNSNGSVVTFNNSENSTTVLCGFTITNGLATYGSGIRCWTNSSPSLQNVTIIGNSADYGGGVFCYNNSSPSLQNITITNNITSNGGGGIYCTNSCSPWLENVTISDNSTSSFGGGIYCNDASNPILQNVIISGNFADFGGGISCGYSSPNLENVTISGNTASGVSGRGGGIYFTNCSNPSLENVTISGNSSLDYGGGIYCYSSSPNLENVTITGNITSSYGGGISCYDSNLNLINSILWNDSPEEIYFTDAGNPNTITISYSDIQGGEAGIITSNNGTVYWLDGNIDSDPLFVNSGIGDYHLQSISPCIDAGDPASPLDPDGTIADMGAYYFHQLNANFTADTTNGYLPLTVNFTDLSTQGSGVIDEWYWDFGDGNYSSLQDPVNEYQLLGNYAVSLTVTDVYDSTDTETKMDYITVNPPAYSGPVWHISTTGSDVWGNGSTQYPFATIQHGINTSSNTDTVLVQPGTFVENINYNGKLITVGSLFLTTLDTTYISSTIIDGNSSGSVAKFENGEDSSAILCGFTITNGLASGSFPENSGGGILCYDSSPCLQNVTITGNSANYSGGGIYCYSNSSPILENATISDNSAAGYGGGICCVDYSSPILEKVTISGNSATYSGGGILCNNSNPSLQNVTISGNSASDGGGIYCYYSDPVFINSILWSDSPQEIYIVSGSVTATYSDIEGGWTGTGNIYSDPLFVDPANGDYHLQSTSPCIDAGDPASPLDPDGTIADMGAYYFDQTIAPDPPQNVTVEIIGTDVHLSWDAVTGANSYKVYSSDDPYTGFVEETSGSFVGENWSAPIGDVKKFYYVIASTETTRSKDSDSQDAYQPGRRSRRYESDKFIKRRRK